jgi:isopenicillin N synthase-like dioxygenase
MRWTNGRWKNTVHRVLEPPSTNASQTHDNSGLIAERYSIAFYSFPNAETIVEPLGSCCSDQHPKRWGPIKAGDYLLRKRAVLYS